MNDKVTLVTAFFSINRGSWKKDRRSDRKYFEFFKYWAGIRNDLIVYIEDESLKSEILDVRSKVSGVTTEVVVVDDIFNEDQELYLGLKNVNYSKLNAYRLLPDNPESINPEYNYIMMMKYHLLAQAIREFKITNNIAWIDFGYDHGGGNYSQDYFDFELKYQSDCVTMFSLFDVNTIDNLSAIDLILKMETVIQGSFVIGPADKMILMANDAIEAQKNLNCCGIMDDDQITLLMAYYKRKENYKIIHCAWHTSLYYLRENRIVACDETKDIKAFARKIKWLKIKLCCALRVFKELLRMSVPM